jgi:hypothetical protein
MTLNDLLTSKAIDPQGVLVLRHRPSEPALNRVLPWLAAEIPEIFNAYQQAQTEKVETAMTRAAYVASFLGHGPGKALFAGLYAINGSRPLRDDEQHPYYDELIAQGMGPSPLSERQRTVLWFDLALTEFYSSWRGKLIVGWPPPERSWWRRAHRNEMPVLAVLEDSAFDAKMPPWDRIVLTWEQLGVLPRRWREALSHWRGIYYIFDASAGKGYVGAAYGQANILGRWLNYADSGHGGNQLLRQCDHRHFQFSILQRVSPDMADEEVIGVEVTWKERLHTRSPFGLNDN